MSVHIDVLSEDKYNENVANEGLFKIDYSTFEENGQHGGQLVEGYNANKSNINPNSFVGYNFIQLVSEDGGDYDVDNYENYIMQKLDPFYYDSNDAPNLARYMKQFANTGAILLFMDTPNNWVSSYTFSAVTTLVGFLPNGQVVPIASFSWGYSITNGQSSMTGAGPIPVSLPYQTGSIIQNYNFDAQV